MLCEICDKDFKNLAVHMRTKHGIAGPVKKVENLSEMKEMLKEETLQEETLPEIVIDEDKLTTKDRREKLFGKNERDPDRPIREFLDEFGITETELRNITRQYKNGYALSASQSIKAKQDIGIKEAANLAEQSEVETKNIFTAETLEKQYGFAVLEVRSGPPKMWVLRK